MEPFFFTLLHMVMSIVSFSRGNDTTCILQGEPVYPQIWMDGDIIVGGAFPFHSNWEITDLSYLVMPQQMMCVR